MEKVRLYPTGTQERALKFILDVNRELYNALLQERRDAWKRGVRVSSRQQSAELTALRSVEARIDGRLAAVYRGTQDAVLHRLDLAFEAFFRRLKAGEIPGYPRFKAAGRWSQFESSPLIHRGETCASNPFLIGLCSMRGSVYSTK